jgi:hypothetical protein
VTSCKWFGFAIVVGVGTWLINNPSLSADCAQGDALTCYTQALVRLQAAEDALGAARKDIASLQTQINTLQGSSATMRQEIEALKAAVAATNQGISVIDTQTKPVRPGGAACILVRDVMEVPTGWVPKGEFGIIQNKASGDAFRRGADYNAGWWWEHGQIACAK